MPHQLYDKKEEVEKVFKEEWKLSPYKIISYYEMGEYENLKCPLHLLILICP